MLVVGARRSRKRIEPRSAISREASESPSGRRASAAPEAGPEKAPRSPGEQKKLRERLHPSTRSLGDPTMRTGAAVASRGRSFARRKSNVAWPRHARARWIPCRARRHLGRLYRPSTYAAPPHREAAFVATTVSFGKSAGGAASAVSVADTGRPTPRTRPGSPRSPRGRRERAKWRTPGSPTRNAAKATRSTRVSFESISSPDRVL